MKHSWIRISSLLLALLMAISTITLVACADDPIEEQPPEQLDFYTDYEALERQKAEEEERLFREKNMQKALIGIKKKYGKNAVLKGMNLEEGATTVERNGQVGGHRAEKEK